MTHKNKWYLATIFFSIIPLIVLSEQIETQISADTITVEQGGILNAEGNVVVQYGKRQINFLKIKAFVIF